MRSLQGEGGGWSDILEGTKKNGGFIDYKLTHAQTQQKKKKNVLKKKRNTSGKKGL